MVSLFYLLNRILSVFNHILSFTLYSNLLDINNSARRLYSVQQRPPVSGPRIFVQICYLSLPPTKQQFRMCGDHQTSSTCA